MFSCNIANVNISTSDMYDKASSVKIKLYHNIIVTYNIIHIYSTINHDEITTKI